MDSLTEGADGFAAGTLVHTKEGLKPIEGIRVGDWVLSYPDDQIPPRAYREDLEAKFIYRQVKQTFVHEARLICEVAVLNFAAGVEEVIEVTPDHPFYVKNERWVLARDLNFRKVLKNCVFGDSVVGKVSDLGGLSRVFDIDIDEFHTYFVGEIGSWVHGACE